MKNFGIKNENLFIKAINDKKYYELNFLLQELVEFLFPNVDKNSQIKCFKNIFYEKGDICVEINNIVKYISIKTGIKNSVHSESIGKFVIFLKSMNVEDTIIDEILKYHYADGTIDGSGLIRESAQEYKIKNSNIINLINIKLQNDKLLNSIVERFILKGTQMQSNRIDVLIYGSPEDFYFITPEDIKEYILSKKNSYSSALHFSCLTMQPLARVLDFNKKEEYKRHWIQIKWYNLEDNIIEILNTKFIKKVKYDKI